MLLHTDLYAYSCHFRNVFKFLDARHRCYFLNVSVSRSTIYSEKSRNLASEPINHDIYLAYCHILILRTTGDICIRVGVKPPEILQ